MVITSAKVGYGIFSHCLFVRLCVCLSVCLSAGYLKMLLTNFDQFFRGVGCVTGNRWLDLGSVLDRDADSEIFERNFFIITG